MMNAFIKLTPKHVPLREKYIAGWEKLHRKPNQQNHLQEAVRVFQISEVGTPEHQRIQIGKVIKGPKIVKWKGDRRTGEVSWVNGWSFTLAGETNPPEWSSSYGNRG